MNPIDKAELSAFLDGELDTLRSEEIKLALKNDPTLRAEFESLSAMDATWSESARSAAERVAIDLLPRKKSSNVALRVAGAVLLLTTVRMLPKFTDELMWGIVLHSVALACSLVWVIRMVSETELEPSIPDTTLGK